MAAAPYTQQYIPGNFKPVLIGNTDTPEPLPTGYGEPIYGIKGGKEGTRTLIGRVGMTPVVTSHTTGKGDESQTITYKDDPAYQKSQKQIDFEKKIASGEVESTGNYEYSSDPREKRSFADRSGAYSSYDPATNLVTIYDPEGNVTQQGPRAGSVLGGALGSLMTGFNDLAADPNFQSAVIGAAMAVVAPYAAAQMAPYLTGFGSYAGVAAQAITNVAIEVAKGVPFEKAAENALTSAAVSGVSSEVQQSLGNFVTDPGVSNAIKSTVSSGLATAAKGGSQADIEKAMTAGLVSSAASTAYKEAADASSPIASAAVGGAAGGAVTGGTEGAVLGGLTSAAGALGSDLAADLKAKNKAAADTAALPAEQVAATPSGGLTAENLTKLAEESAKLIGPAEPPTAALDTGVVSDAGTRVQVSGVPYLAENAPENIKNLIPPGYRLLSEEESLPQNVKATLLPNGEYAFIGQDTSPEYLATQELPTETIPSTGQVAGVDLTAPEVVPTTPEAAAVGIGGPAPDVAPEVAVTAPGAEESATVVRVDPSTGEALVMNPSGEVFTITVDPSTKAGSTISVPSSKVGAGRAPATGAPGVGTGTGAGANTGVGTGTGAGTGTGTGIGAGVGSREGVESGTGVATGTSADTGVGTGTDVVVGADTGVGTGTGTTNVSDVSDTDQPILDLIAERPTATDVAAPVEVDTSIPRVDVYGSNKPEDIPRVDVYGSNWPIEPSPVTGLDIASEPSKDQPILDLIAEESKKTLVAEPEQPVYDYDPKAKPEPDIFTKTYLSPKTKTAAPTSALGSALGTTGLTSYRGAGEIEGAGSGKPRKKVWNEESLKLKDALGV